MTSTKRRRLSSSSTAATTTAATTAANNTHVDGATISSHSKMNCIVLSKNTYNCIIIDVFISSSSMFFERYKAYQ